MSRRHREIWSDPDQASVVLSSGPIRVVTNTDEDPDFKPRPVGFTATIEPLEETPR